MKNRLSLTKIDTAFLTNLHTNYNHIPCYLKQINKYYIRTTIINTFSDKNTTSSLSLVAQRFKPKLRAPAAKTYLKHHTG